MATLIILSAIFAFLSLYGVDAAYCSGSPQPGERVNEIPIFDKEVRYVKSVKNGMLFEAGPLNASFPIVHVWGTPYEAGYAQGLLQKQQIKEFVYKTWGYLSSEILMELYGDKLPQWAKAIIINQGLEAALDWSRDVTAPFTPQSYFDEVKGLADATGMSYDMLMRLNLFPELTKAQCSFFGAWGKAVA
jgi:isopenicillin-N N-acyltransferase like protein